MQEPPEVARTSLGFLSIEDLVPHQGELTITFDFDEDTHQASVEACAPLVADTMQEDIAAAYISLCNSASPNFEPLFLTPKIPKCKALATMQSCALSIAFENAKLPTVIFAGKKYKPIALKIHPIETKLPSRYRIIREIKGDPLENLPQLAMHLADFAPTGRYTTEHKEQFDKVHNTGFLLPKEQELIHQFMCLQNGDFTWTDHERGNFWEDFFPPIGILTIPHKPWAQQNIPIPPGIYDKVCHLIKNKIDTSVYEPSNSSYQLCWFCIVKKDGKLLHIVHSLELLNKVTIKHTGVTPFTNQIGKHFAGRTCGSMLNLYIGYDKRGISAKSHNLTTFQSLFGALRLVTLPMGWTNSVPIFHNDVTYILQPEIPKVTVPYINNVPICRPAEQYILANETDEHIPENPGIHQFVWEHFQGLNCIFQ